MPPTPQMILLHSRAFSDPGQYANGPMTHLLRSSSWQYATGSITDLLAASLVWVNVSLCSSIATLQSIGDEVKAATHQINARHKDRNTCEICKADGHTAHASCNLGPLISPCSGMRGIASWQCICILCENPWLYHQHQNPTKQQQQNQAVINPIFQDQSPGSGNNYPDTASH